MTAGIDDIDIEKAHRPTQRTEKVRARPDQSRQSLLHRGGVRMGNEELISMISVADDIGAVDTCLDIFQESWTTSNNKLVIAPLAFQKAVQRCRSTMELTLHDSTKNCNAESWRYFTLMSIFSSLTGMLSLLSLYLYIKI